MGWPTSGSAEQVQQPNGGGEYADRGEHISTTTSTQRGQCPLLPRYRAILVDIECGFRVGPATNGLLLEVEGCGIARGVSILTSLFLSFFVFHFSLLRNLLAVVLYN